MRHILKFISCLMLLICSTLPISAAEDNLSSNGIPFTHSYYYHFSKDQQLDSLIKDFCSMQGISVVVSPIITDIVNGRFNKMDPADFWDYVTQAYGLSWFYDGKILYVYKSSELQTQIFKMDASGIATMSNIIKHLGFSSSDFSFRSVPSANILIITAPPKYLETINDLSVKFVTEKITDTTIVKTFPLKYAWAYDMSFTYKDGSITVPGISTLLQNIVTGNQTAYSISNMAVNLDSKSAHKQTKMQTLVPQNNPLINNQNNNNNSSSSNDNNQKSSDTENIPTTASLPGFITCDQRLNAVIIRDKYENMQFYEDIIKQLDVPCDVIKIDVAIVDIDQSKNVDLGLGYIGLDNNQKRVLDIGFEGTGSANKNGVSLSGAANVFGKMTGVLKGYTIASYLQALEKHGDTKTVAKPSVLTLDNVGAIIEKEETVYTKVSGTYSEGLYDISATIRLQVVPHIIPNDQNEDGEKKMKMFVNIQDGSFSNLADTETTPTCNSNSINTQAVLYEGQSLLIGGYFKENYINSASGVPFLQRIPLIGKAFKYTSNEKKVLERIYVISPSIVDINSQDSKFEKFVQGGDLEKLGKFLPVEPNQDKKAKPRWRH